MTTSTLQTHDNKAVEHRAINKLFRRLIVFLFILFVFSFLDRINIGFAGLTMGKDLGLTSTMFGLAATLFYVTYVLCGIPSNIMLAKIGARRWIAGIMVVWGIASTCTMFATSPKRSTSCACWWALPKPVSCRGSWSISPGGSRPITAPAPTRCL
jgi:ACS family 4-hydroxyphenylacetate permease-like MFS transporter